MSSIKLCPNGIRKTYLVSFPRSGHHLLVRGLTEALSHRLIYCEFYNGRHNFEHCEWTNLQKSHDFDLQLPFDEQYNYIILIRAFELAIDSWYANVIKYEGYEGDLETFRDGKKEYFDAFNEKWVISPSADNKLIITYADLVDHKIDTVSRCARFMRADPDMDKLIKWERRERVK